MAFRTDLALEALEHMPRGAGQAGVKREEETRQGLSLTRVTITDGTGERALGKPQGSYCTLSLSALLRREEDAFVRACTVLSEELAALLPPETRAPVLVAGLGNRDITPDAVGPLAAGNTLATRHLIGQAPDIFRAFRPVCVVAPGVLGQTGVETGELLQGVLDIVRPQAVIAVDALACSRLSRLLRTVQLTDTGIVPGSGVDNARQGLNRETLGVPVIAVGVPTVVDGATLAHEILQQSAGISSEALDDLMQPMVVTARDIDREVSAIARLIGYAVNKALHPKLSIEEIDELLS